MYGHNDNRSKKDIKYSSNELLFFIFSKYKERLPQQYQQKNCVKFFHQMDELRKSRYVCGVLLWNESNDLLCIIDSTGKLDMSLNKLVKTCKWSWCRHNVEGQLIQSKNPRSRYVPVRS